MVLNRHRRYKGYRIFGLLVALLCLFIPYTGAWSQGKGLGAEDARQRSAAKGLHVVVQEGRLSVDVQEADLGEVLAQIGRQAGIRIVSGPSSGTRVSTRFAGVELEEGLRRLLRLGSLSHIFLYTNGPVGTVTIAELRVLGEGTAAPPRPTTGAEPGVPAGGSLTGTPGRKAQPQARTGAALPERSAESEVHEPVPDVVESAPESTPDPGQAEPSEAIRRLLDVFTQSKQMGARPPDDQATTPPEPEPPGQELRDVGEGAR